VRGAIVRIALALALALGCGPQVAIDDAGESGTAGSGSAGHGATSAASGTAASTTVNASTSGPGPGSVTGDPTAPTSVSTSTGDGTGFEELNFIDDGFDDAGCGFDPREGRYDCTFECDVLAQDCPLGEKCMPWANDGGAHWNATRCSPIDSTPAQVGDACLVEGSFVSGIDECDLGLMCLHVDPEGEGVCVAMCTGTAAMPVCEGEGTQCMIRYDGAIALCVETCDPVAGSCALGDCVPIDAGVAGPVGFGCFVDTGDAMPGEPCERPGDCGSGATCNFGSPECPDVFGCCASYCDLEAAEPDAPCLPGQICTQIFGPEDADPEVAHFGMCMAP
jgi:hypothetical protein